MESKGHKPVSFQQYITVIEPNKRIQKLLNLEDDCGVYRELYEFIRYGNDL